MKQKSTTANSSDDFACPCLKAALSACIDNDILLVQSQCEKFLTALKEYRIVKPSAQKTREKESPDGNLSLAILTDEAPEAIYPTESIPLDLASLCRCLQKKNRADTADNIIEGVISVLYQDKKLGFLQQNVFQELAFYFIDNDRYFEADDLLNRQSKIVSKKGSKVLIDFVEANRLINLGNLFSSQNNFVEAEETFHQALLLIETIPERHSKQVEVLHESFTKLELCKQNSCA